LDNIKKQLEADREKQAKKKEDLKQLAELMKQENEDHKARRVQAKQQQRENDVFLSKQYIEMVN
jgi:hypothetical protein